MQFYVFPVKFCQTDILQLFAKLMILDENIGGLIYTVTVVIIFLPFCIDFHYLTVSVNRIVY